MTGDYDYAAHTARDRARRGLPPTVEDPQALHATAALFLAGRSAGLLDATGRRVGRVGGASGTSPVGPGHPTAGEVDGGVPPVTASASPAVPEDKNASAAYGLSPAAEAS